MAKRKAVLLRLDPKLHADQLSDGGGAELAAHFKALSADHLEYTNDAGESKWISRKVALNSDAFFHIMNRTYSELVGGVYVALGLVLCVPYGLGAFMGRKPWMYVFGIILIGLTLTS